jgi:anti-sigma B factor antagonist
MGGIEDRGADIAIETHTDSAGVPIVVVSGELDSSNAARLDAAVATAVGGQPQRLVFDLSALRFMDSAGIAVLVGAAGKVKAVQLRNPSEAARRVIELTGLSSVLPTET